MPRHISCGAGRSGEDVLVEVDTGRAQARHEGEDVGGFENPAQGTDRRADSAGERYCLSVVEQIEGRHVTTRLDEQVARPDPVAIRYHTAVRFHVIPKGYG